MVAETEQKVIETIQRALNLEDNMLTSKSSMHDIEEWDSLGHLEILAALNKAFDRKVASIKEIATADSVEKIVGVLKENSLI